ncbi:MAG: N-acetyltransferase [Pyrinomonadaceae bacterium]|nr:N-acetyltransferase [Pyrinomonadaceae bacterium]MBP6212299.1 N-acetyltransferase [Pyrinomonadaceae bacterium]
MIVRPAVADDAVQIAYIYNHYIATSHATFELDPINGDEMLRRMELDGHPKFPFFVYEADGVVCGYAFGRKFGEREAYRQTIEISVYIRPGKDGTGIGSELYRRLIDEIRSLDHHAVIAGISLPNEPSVHLHEKFGFEKVAHFREVGRKFDRWIDVGYWQLVLE